ncbi:ankyrin repeat-containing protein [Toxoplasma gondii RUB]|uniref:Ankyrin repeat-containing protein n=1 Tax=Toxoplasma gondii RUB TaxID=935652 RepID=A0A086LLR2_TOXGO|nr:ankyrin repeat-containing protein [Toxoplasma gondii RUB]
MAPHLLLPSCSSPCRPSGSPETAEALLAAATKSKSASKSPPAASSFSLAPEASDAKPDAPMASCPPSDAACPAAAPAASPPDENPRRTRAKPDVTPTACSAGELPRPAAAPAFPSGSEVVTRFEPDAQIAEALLNGYRLSEDTAGDADFTFPLDFQMPLNYEIYSFISQCLNATQLKQSLSEQGADAVPAVAKSLLAAGLAKAREERRGGSCARERRESAERTPKRTEEMSGQRKEPEENAWPTLEAGAATQRRQLEKENNERGQPARPATGKQSKCRKQWKVKEQNDREETPAASAPAETPGAPVSSDSASPQTAQPAALLGPAPLASPTVRAPPGLSGPDVNTALLRAAFLGREDIVDLCLKRGGDVSFSDRVGRSALHYGAATGTERIVRKLLEAGGAKNINQRDRKHWTPLLIAVTKTHSACVRLLLEKGAEVGATLCHRCAPCRSSAQRAPETRESEKSEKDGQAKDAAEAAEAAEANASEKAEAKTDVKPSACGAGEAEGPIQTWSAAIHFAAIKGNIEISKLLLDYGATVNDLDSDKRPPLHYAACRDNSHYVSWLLARGARLDLFDVNGRSALHAAAIKGQLQNAQSILEAADPVTALLLLRRKDKWDITPAQLAKLHGQNGAFLLLKSYADQLEATLGEHAALIEPETADACLLNQTITEVLATGMQEVKKNKLERTVARLGTVTCLKAYQKTMMVQGMGGMLVADGSRPKTAGGVFFTLLREMARQGEISRDDLVYIEMEDGEAKKALRRRARQKHSSSSGAEAAPRLPHRTPAAASGRENRQLAGNSTRPMNAPEGARGPASRRPGGKQRPEGSAKTQESVQTSHPSQGNSSTSRKNSVGFFVSAKNFSKPAVPPRLAPSAAKTRPGSALSSKSSGASTVGGCAYTPLAMAIDAETLSSNSSSRGSSPQQQTPTNFPAVGSFVGSQPQGFLPFSMYPVYPFWPMGFPTPLSPPPVMGASLAGKEDAPSFFSTPSFYPQAPGASAFFRGEKGDGHKKKASGLVPNFAPFFPGAPGMYVHPREESDAQAASRKKGKSQRKKGREEEETKREEAAGRVNAEADGVSCEGQGEKEANERTVEAPRARIPQEQNARPNASVEKPPSRDKGADEDGWKVVKSRHEKRTHEPGNARGRGGRGRSDRARGRGGRRSPE